MGKGEFEEVHLKHNWESATWECLYVHRKITTVLVRSRGRHQDGWKENFDDPCGQVCEKQLTWKVRTSWVNQVVLHSQREAQADQEAVQAKGNYFDELPPLKMTHEKQTNNTKFLLNDHCVAWRHGRIRRPRC